MTINQNIKMKIKIKVWFMCKLCGGSFRHIDRFIYHKEQKHFKEFLKNRNKCIIFEECILVEDFTDDNGLELDSQLEVPINSECDSDQDFESENLNEEDNGNENTNCSTHLPKSSKNIKQLKTTFKSKRQKSHPFRKPKRSSKTIVSNNNKNKNHIVKQEQSDMTLSLVNSIDDNQETDVKPSVNADLDTNTTHFDLHIDPFQNITIVRSFANNSYFNLNVDEQPIPKLPQTKKQNKRRNQESQSHLKPNRKNKKPSDISKRKRSKRQNVKSELFVFPVEECDVDQASQVTLKDWLLKQNHIVSSDKNVILLDPDPTLSGLDLEPISIDNENPIECKLCSKRLTSESQVRIHVTHCYFHNKLRHNYCIPCQKKFPNPFYLRRHALNIHGTEEEKASRYIFQCSLCPKKFMEKRRFYLHTESHKSKEEQFRPFVCEYCGKSFLIEYHLNQHIKRHSDSRPFTCPHPNCKQLFKTKQILRVHSKIHSDAKPFQCPHPGCGKSFKYKRYVGMHLPVHTKDRRYLCTADNCGKNFSTSFILKLHRKTKHGIDGNLPEYKCHLCNRIYHMKQSLRNHIVGAHTIEKPFKCEYEGCSAKYKIKYQLDYHLKHVHFHFKNESESEEMKAKLKKLKPFSCHICGLSFRLRYFLRNHLTTHSEERPFKCSYSGCFLSFKTKNGLHIHRQIHSNVKRFKCPEQGCPKMFKVKRYMTMHFDQVHRGYRPYKCGEEGCEKSFYNANGYKIHLKTKHGQNGDLPKFVCQVCDQVFYKKTLLENHSVSHHMAASTTSVKEESDNDNDSYEDIHFELVTI